MRPLPEEVELVTRFKAEIERHLLFSEFPKLSFPKGHGVSPFLNHASRVDRLLGLAATDPEGLVRRLDLRRRCVQPPIVIGNDGTAPANDIVVRIAKADRVCFLADDDLADGNLWMPSATNAHAEIVELARRFESGELESKRWAVPSFPEIALPTFPSVERQAGPPPPSVRVRDGDLVLKFPRKLQHGSEFVMTLDDLWLVPDLPAGKERRLRYECISDDIARPVHGELRVVASEECQAEH